MKKFAQEWLDTLVVAISVAMAFRAYFYEPFNIPTGSMQETLWGYHTVEGEKMTAWDIFPVSLLKWAYTGETHVDIEADRSGTARVTPRNDGFANISIGSSTKVHKLPTDAAKSLVGKYYTKGDTVWEGTKATGDFIFVNRWKWNFRKPRVGDVMIFSTTGINGLQQGTHYIKRMKATPGMTYELEHRPIGPDGKVIDELPSVVTMGEDEYFACGDNFNNSFDSRYWGPVPGRLLRGTASVVFWPFNKWRVVK